MTEVEKMMAARRVWIYDLQGEGDKGYDNEMQVFSNEDACRDYFVKMYGKRIHDWPWLPDSQAYEDYIALDKGEKVDDPDFGDDYEAEAKYSFEEEMVRKALAAYDHATDNLGGYSEEGYIFRVIRTDLIDEAAELWD